MLEKSGEQNRRVWRAKAEGRTKRWLTAAIRALPSVSQNKNAQRAGPAYPPPAARWFDLCEGMMPRLARMSTCEPGLCTLCTAVRLLRKSKNLTRVCCSRFRGQPPRR